MKLRLIIRNRTLFTKGNSPNIRLAVKSCRKLATIGVTLEIIEVNDMKAFYFGIIFTLVFLLLTYANMANAKITDGLVSAWPFDGNLKDSVGNNDGEFFSGNPNSKPNVDTGPANPKKGIVSAWNFDGNLDDDVDGNNGEFKGAPAKNDPVYVNGKFGRAILFDGIDDYIEIPDKKSLHHHYRRDFLQRNSRLHLFLVNLNRKCKSHSQSI